MGEDGFGLSLLTTIGSVPKALILVNVGRTRWMDRVYLYGRSMGAVGGRVILPGIMTNPVPSSFYFEVNIEKEACEVENWRS